MIEKGIIDKDTKRKEIEDKYDDWIPEEEKKENEEKNDNRAGDEMLADDSRSSTPLPALENTRNNMFFTPPKPNVQHVPFNPEERQQLKELYDLPDEEIDEIELQKGSGRSTRGLYTSQIEEMIKQYKPNYLGCIASNEIKSLLPSIKKQRQLCFIQNTDDKKGLHWIAWFIDRDRKTIEYYDSLADPLPKDLFKNIQPLLKKISATGVKWKWKYNLIRDQNYNSDTCGWFAMIFLKDRLNGVLFQIASHYERGEKRVKEVMKNMKHQFTYVDGLTGEGWRDVLASAWNATKNIGKKVIDKVKMLLV